MNKLVTPLPEQEILNAKLPAKYTAAKKALEECNRVDECMNWANKMHALASYARQAKDETLKNMAARVQARAIRRCGELLSQGKNQTGRRTDRGVQGPPTRLELARAAGLSRGQMRQAIQVAQLPKKEFETAVEATPAPTTISLAVQGVKANRRFHRTRRPRPGSGVRPTLQLMRLLVGRIGKVSPEEIASFLNGHQSYVVEEYIQQLRAWLDELEIAIGGKDVTSQAKNPAVHREL